MCAGLREPLNFWCRCVYGAWRVYCSAYSACTVLLTVFTYSVRGRCTRDTERYRRQRSPSGSQSAPLIRIRATFQFIPKHHHHEIYLHRPHRRFGRNQLCPYRWPNGRYVNLRKLCPSYFLHPRKDNLDSICSSTVCFLTFSTYNYSLFLYSLRSKRLLCPQCQCCADSIPHFWLCLPCLRLCCPFARSCLPMCCLHWPSRCKSFSCLIVMCFRHLEDLSKLTPPLPPL